MVSCFGVVDGVHHYYLSAHRTKELTSTTESPLLNPFSDMWLPSSGIPMIDKDASQNDHSGIRVLKVRSTHLMSSFLSAHAKLRQI